MALLTDPARSRQLAVGLLVAVALAVVAAVAIPVWMLHRHYDTALAEDRDMLERYRRIASTRPLLKRELDAMRARDPRKFFLRSGGAALSAAEAQEVLRSLVESSGGRLISMQAPASKDEGRYRQVTVNAQLTANIFTLRKILFAIESGTPFLFIDNLMVRTQVPGNFKPAPGAEPDMFVSFEIYGYALTGS
jgi:general secretion pathway protein M